MQGNAGTLARMATYWLLNTVRLNATTLLVAGKKIDDAIIPSASVTAVGGRLWPTGDAIVDTAAVFAADSQRQGQGDPDSIMQAAAIASLKQSGGGGGGAGTPHAPFIAAGDGVRSSDTIPAGYLAYSGQLVINNSLIDPGYWSVVGTTLSYWFDLAQSVPFVPALGARIVFTFATSS